MASAEDRRDPIDQITLTMQIISIALVIGVGTFLGLTVGGLRSTIFDANPWSFDKPLTPIALGMGAVMLAIHWPIEKSVINGAIRSQAQGKRPEGMPPSTGDKKDDETWALLAARQTGLIVGSALLEGAAFFNAVAYMLEGKATTLIAVLLLLVALSHRIPTRTRLETWVENQRGRLAEERVGG